MICRNFTFFKTAFVIRKQAYVQCRKQTYINQSTIATVQDRQKEE